jgi:hypothetical protein
MLPEEIESKIFVRDHLTDFEKLLFAEKAIKDFKKENVELKIENGKLSAFILEIEANNKRSKEEIKEFRAKSYNRAILEENKYLRERNKKLKRDNAHLINKLYLISKDK